MPTATAVKAPTTRLVYDKSGTEIIEIRNYYNTSLTRATKTNRGPDACARLLLDLQHLDLGQYETIVVDSVSYFELAARKYAEYVLDPNARDPRRWFAASTDILEEVLLVFLAGLNKNVVVVTHIDEDKDEVHGGFLRTPKAPGRLRKTLPSGYGEMYRAYVRTEGDKKQWLLQTEGDPIWNASSQLRAPNPCPPVYDALWANWNPKLQQVDKQGHAMAGRNPLHVVVMGDPGARKSTFAATFPKPMLVLNFDPMGKETPYLLVGETWEWTED